ncbi:MAG: LPP20 family lipoprotein [Bacteroidales bacterium]|nr:LPP20 family lipoprotein [Bacteroidales bacterium]
MRQFLLLFIFTLFNLNGFGQTSEFEKIKASDQYIWGLGISEDYDQATKLALDDLIGKISVSVESKFEYVAQEDNTDLKTYSKSVISTYSSANLTDVMQLQSYRRGTYSILRYIEKEQLKKVFERRENKLRDYLQLGEKARQEARIGDALRYYYWSYALYLSHPYRADIRLTEEGRELMVGTVLNDRINALLSAVDFKITDRLKDEDGNKTRLIISSNYKGENVKNLDFRCNIGGSVTPLHEVSGGRSEVYLYGIEQQAIEKLDINIEYKYLTKCYQDKELVSVFEAIQIPAFSRASKSVLVPADEAKKFVAKKMIKPVFESVNKLEDPKKFYTKTIDRLLVSIAEKKYSDAYPYFTPEGLDMFQKLIQYGQVSIGPLTDTLKIVRLIDETQVRSVPMTFYFPNSNKRFMENVVFTFNDQLLISAISFAISDITIDGIVNRGENYGSITDKYTLIKFMEYYKTAYNLKRLDYIESIFSENALIIVGTVLKLAKPIDGLYQNIGEVGVDYQRYTKKEYITRLQNAFNSKEFINIDFDEAEVRKMNGDKKIYGIQISQHYYSSNYSDFGYLFLMIDLNDSLNPTIYVRTWQPQKNNDGSIYGLDDFRLN